MKKILLGVSMILLSFIMCATVSASIPVNYTPIFIDDKMWTLDDGDLVDDVNWSATYQVKLATDTVVFSSDLGNHVLFWNKNNLYIGYTNVGTAPETWFGKYLGDLYVEGTNTLTPPGDADRFAVIQNKTDTDRMDDDGYLQYESADTTLTDTFETHVITTAYNDSVLNADLDDIMSAPSWLDMEVDVSGYPALSDVFYILDLINYANSPSLNDILDDYDVSLYTLDQVLPTNLITNGDFASDLSGWAVGDTVSTWENGMLKQIATAQYGGAFQQYNFVSGKSYYFNLDYITSSIYQRLYICGGTQADYSNGLGVLTNYSALITSTVSGTLRSISLRDYRSSGWSYSWLDNCVFYDVSALKTAGLFGGMSDSAIKTVLDDYAVNGLTVSNAKYFYAGGSVSIVEDILYYFGYNIGDGEYPSFLDPDFENNHFVAIQTGTDLSDLMVFSGDDCGYSSFEWGTDTNSNSVFDEEDAYTLIEIYGDPDYRNDLYFASSIRMIDLLRLDENVLIDVGEEVGTDWKLYSADTTRDYYIDLYWEAVDESTPSKYVWYTGTHANPTGITSSNFNYYETLYTEALLYTYASRTYWRWEWFATSGVNASNYADILAQYDLWLPYVGITWSFVIFDILDFTGTLPDLPTDEPLSTDIGDFFDDVGIDDFGMFAISVGIMIVVAVILGFMHSPGIGYLISEGVLFLVFIALGWFETWVAIVVVIVAFVLAILLFKSR